MQQNQGNQSLWAGLGILCWNLPEAQFYVVLHVKIIWGPADFLYMLDPDWQQTGS